MAEKYRIRETHLNGKPLFVAEKLDENRFNKGWRKYLYSEYENKESCEEAMKKNIAREIALYSVSPTDIIHEFNY